MDSHEPIRCNVENRNDRVMALICHLASFPIFAGYGFIATLIIWLIKKDESSFIDDQGKEALNFQISMFIVGVIGAVLSPFLIGIPILVVVAVMTVVLPVIAAIRSNDGILYRYPFIFRLI